VVDKVDRVTGERRTYKIDYEPLSPGIYRTNKPATRTVRLQDVVIMHSDLTSLLCGVDTTIETAAATASNILGSSNANAWIATAQDIAKTYIERHKQNNLFPSQKDVCDHVETELRTQKIYGTHGNPLEATYIQRNAIQGKWWRTNKP
jgi:hypothetical protein